MRAFLVASVAITCLLCLSGCMTTSPYQQQADALGQSYNAGLITANEYFARMNELQALDLQHRQNVVNACMQINAQYQQQQMQRAQQRQQILNNFRTGSGTIYGPNGSYQYNWTEY
jgi:hypothetical protein